MLEVRGDITAEITRPKIKDGRKASSVAYVSILKAPEDSVRSTTGNDLCASSHNQDRISTNWE